MLAGTTWRTRGSALRQGWSSSRTRATRRRSLPTKNSNAALRRATGLTRGYQDDSSSKRPAASVPFGFRGRDAPSPSRYKINPFGEQELDGRPFHISRARRRRAEACRGTGRTAGGRTREAPVRRDEREPITARASWAEPTGHGRGRVALNGEDPATGTVGRVETGVL